MTQSRKELHKNYRQEILKDSNSLSKHLQELDNELITISKKLFGLFPNLKEIVEQKESQTFELRKKTNLIHSTKRQSTILSLPSLIRIKALAEKIDFYYESYEIDQTQLKLKVEKLLEQIQESFDEKAVRFKEKLIKQQHTLDDALVASIDEIREDFHSALVHLIESKNDDVNNQKDLEQEFKNDYSQSRKKLLELVKENDEEIFHTIMEDADVLGKVETMISIPKNAKWYKYIIIVFDFLLIIVAILTLVLL